MGATTWTAYGTETNFLTTEMDSKADGSVAVGTTVLDNTSNLIMFMDLNIALGSIVSTTGAHVDIRVLSNIDGTNYEDLESAALYAASINVGTSAKRASIIGIPLRPGEYKINLTNETGVALASSGNSVKYRTYGPTTA